jgi:hypothetical protein
MKIAVQIAGAIALLAFAVLCAIACEFLTAARQVAEDLPATVIAEVSNEANLTRILVHAELAAAETMVNARLASLQDDLNAKVDLARGDLNTQASLFRATLDAQAGAANQSLARAVSGTETVAVELSGSLRDLKPSIAGANLLMKPNALPAQLLGTLGATKITMGHVAQMSAAIAKETPATAAAVRGTAVDVHRAADEFTRKKRWWERLLGPLVGAARAGAAFL